MSKHEKPRSVEKIARNGRPCLAICVDKHCARGGAKQLLHAAHAALDRAGLTATVGVELTKCQDYCDDAPALTLLPGAYVYVELTPAAVGEIVAEHIGQGRPVKSLLHKRSRKRLMRGERSG